MRANKCLPYEEVSLKGDFKKIFRMFYLKNRFIQTKVQFLMKKVRLFKQINELL